MTLLTVRRGDAPHKHYINGRRVTRDRMDLATATARVLDTFRTVRKGSAFYHYCEAR